MLDCLSCCFRYFNNYEPIDNKHEVEISESPTTPSRVSIVYEKTVTFNETTKLLLIPQRQEFIEHGLRNRLWYNQEDFESFKQDYVAELKRGSPRSVQDTISPLGNSASETNV